MARVQYGAIVTELKGKVQGHVFQGGNVGFVLRNKGYTPGISAGKRNVANANLVSITTLWRTLTDAQRADWAAITGSWPFTNKFGATYYGSAFQVFTAYNTILLGEGNDPVTTPAVVASPTDPGPITLNSSGAGNLTLSYTNVDVTTSTMGVFASRPVSVGRNGNRIAMYLLGYYDYSAGTPINIGAAYATKIGQIPSGSKIFVRTTCNRQDWCYPYFKQLANVTIP